MRKSGCKSTSHVVYTLYHVAVHRQFAIRMRVDEKK